MHVFCFLKTPYLIQGIEQYLRKSFAGLAFKEELLPPSFSKTMAFLEDPTFQEMNLVKGLSGIIVGSKKSLSIFRKDFPEFVFIHKPFYLPDILRELARFFQNHFPCAFPAFHIGPFIFQPSERILFHTLQKETIFLTEKETALLEYLCHQKEGRATRGELLKKIWRLREDIPTRTLESHIYTLRKKIESEARSPLYLLTEPGGYRLVYALSYEPCS